MKYNKILLFFILLILLINIIPPFFVDTISAETFGNTSICPESPAYEHKIIGSWFQISENSSPTKIWVYCMSGGVTTKAGIYNYTANGNAGELVAESENVVVSGNWQWRSWDITSYQTLVNGTKYFLVIWMNAAAPFNIKKCSETNKGLYKAEIFDGTFETPLTSESATNHNYSIYCEYTLIANVTTLDAQNVENTSALLKGCSGDGIIGGDTCFFQYNTTGDWINTTENSISNYTYFNQSITSLNPSDMYTFRAAINSSGSYTYGDNKTFLTKPDGPTNPFANFTVGTTLNLSWTKGTGANNTVILRKTTGYPNSITDGTIIYNGTGTYTEITIPEGTTYYIRGWSYSNWSNPSHYKISDIYSDFIFGEITINVYDENTSNPISNWGVEISNEDKTSTYVNYSAFNPLVITVTDLPYGENTIFIFNANFYDTRIYYMDLYPNRQYTLNGYLVEQNDTESYVIRIIDELNLPVADAIVNVMRYINETVGYENVSTLLTNGYGYTPSIELIPNKNYAINIIATGYITATYDLRPVPIIFEDDRYHLFQIYLSVIEPDVESFESIIDFCQDTSWEDSNNTIHVSYYDRNDETLDVTFTVYEYYNKTLYHNYSVSYTNNSDIDFWVSGLNTSRMHKIVIISMNHTTLGNPVNIPCMVGPLIHYDDEISETDLEGKAEDAGGKFSMGYVNFFILFIPSFLIIIGLHGDPGLGILVMSFYLTLATWRIDLIAEPVLLSLISVLIPLGIIVIVSKRGKHIT